MKAHSHGRPTQASSVPSEQNKHQELKINGASNSLISTSNIEIPKGDSLRLVLFILCLERATRNVISAMLTPE